MACTSCNQSSGSSGPSFSSGGSGCGSCGGRKPMDTNKPLRDIRNGDDNFCFNQIGNKECQSLGSDKGIHPVGDKHRSSCDDLKSLNDLGIGTLHNDLMMLDICNIEQLKCWLFSLLSWLWNINKAIICTLCGQRCEINKLKNVVRDLAYSNTDTQGGYIVKEETPGLSVTVRKDGTFTYDWTDWDNTTKPWTKLGAGHMTGKLNLKLNTNSKGGLDYTIDGVHVNTISYKTENKFTGNSQPTYHILVPSGGTDVWSKKGNVNSNWTETLNKTFAFKNTGTIDPKSSTPFIYFMTWRADWIVDDRVELGFKFINNNNKLDLDC